MKPTDVRSAPAEVTAHAALLRFGTTLPIRCTEVEFDRQGFEIVSAETLAPGDEAELVMSDRRVSLAIVPVVSTAKGETPRYYLRMSGETTDSRALFDNLIGIETVAGGRQVTSSRRGVINGITVRAKRTAADRQVFALVKTWGTQSEYRLPVEDLSRAGALLISQKGDPLPFRLGTLLEAVFSSPLMPGGVQIRCSAKVMRRTDAPSDRRLGEGVIGIQLVELEAEFARHWERLITAVQASKPGDPVAA